MKRVLMALFILCSLSCSKKEKLLGDTAWQRKVNSDFKDASKSPLKKTDLKSFKSLDFFPFNPEFVVTATLERTPGSNWFNMKTTTGEVTRERIYGILRFNLQGNEFKLNVYQGEEHLQSEQFIDYLFLPFLDDTNGDSTYPGGRYLDMRIPMGDTIEIDFNKAYNPYCAYNEKFSCPIVPRENYIATKVEAGLRDFKKN
ncbi:MAG: DUF1684 domain-containing protein [Winogradskyella sp.]|uniref:DUF1684 domain-containing protein n=1 Tax=Winogradskyella sp. TaxID=1883156 RepID=UPI0025F8C79B|nr:DUF1684 domain-containing protein [Winogradskyella sp.]NRB82345.1 DUF1684 domain-containing protein [Winogradskyella sp.]